MPRRVECINGLVLRCSDQHALKKKKGMLNCPSLVSSLSGPAKHKQAEEWHPLTVFILGGKGR
eukprot:1159851-Pelagomonas_calceolata.AAC.1